MRTQAVSTCATGCGSNGQKDCSAPARGRCRTPLAHGWVGRQIKRDRGPSRMGRGAGARGRAGRRRGAPSGGIEEAEIVGALHPTLLVQGLCEVGCASDGLAARATRRDGRGAYARACVREAPRVRPSSAKRAQQEPRSRCERHPVSTRRRSWCARRACLPASTRAALDPADSTSRRRNAPFQRANVVYECSDAAERRARAVRAPVKPGAVARHSQRAQTAGDADQLRCGSVRKHRLGLFRGQWRRANRAWNSGHAGSRAVATWRLRIQRACESAAAARRSGPRQRRASAARAPSTGRRVSDCSVVRACNSAWRLSRERRRAHASSQPPRRMHGRGRAAGCASRRKESAVAAGASF